MDVPCRFHVVFVSGESLSPHRVSTSSPSSLNVGAMRTLVAWHANSTPPTTGVPVPPSVSLPTLSLLSVITRVPLPTIGDTPDRFGRWLCKRQDPRCRRRLRRRHRPPTSPAFPTCCDRPFVTPERARPLATKPCSHIPRQTGGSAG